MHVFYIKKTSLLINYYTCRKSVKETIIEKFAGPYDQGEYSPSVQKTLYDSQCLILKRIPEVGSHTRDFRMSV